MICTCPDAIARPDWRCPTHGSPLPVDLPDEFETAPDPLAPARVMAWLVGALVVAVGLAGTIGFVTYVAGAASIAP